jgi:predicted proteasome-type protease
MKARQEKKLIKKLSVRFYANLSLVIPVDLLLGSNNHFKRAVLKKIKKDDHAKRKNSSRSSNF